MQSASANDHARTLLAAALSTLGLTALHHVYGGLLYDTPWRLHGAFVVVPIGLALIASFTLLRRTPNTHAGRWAGRVLVVVAAVFPIFFVGAFEGAYNHVLKNILYFGGLSGDVFARLFPPPAYELPNDLFFELSGVAQVVPAAIAAAAALRFLHRGRTDRPGDDAGRLAPGAVLPGYELTDLQGLPVLLPDPACLVHLQFRRFAGCPICNAHLASIATRCDAIRAAGVREVVVFHSDARELRRHVEDFPLTVVADPDKRLYAAFGVESAPRALLDPRAWPGIFAAVVLGTIAIARGRAHAPSIRPRGGRLGLPADFLIDEDGRIVDCHYGEHADDQWSVDDILARAARADGARKAR